MRYTELRTSLEGIATNLLSERLKTMEANGIVERRLEDAGVVYALTSWGAGLREPMETLGRWGAPLLATGRGEDAFQPRWLTLALPALLRGATASPAVELGIETDGFLMVLRVDEDGPSAFVPDRDPASVFTAAPDVVVCSSRWSDQHRAGRRRRRVPWRLERPANRAHPCSCERDSADQRRGLRTTEKRRLRGWKQLVLGWCGHVGAPLPNQPDSARSSDLLLEPTHRRPRRATSRANPSLPSSSRTAHCSAAIDPPRSGGEPAVLGRDSHPNEGGSIRHKHLLLNT
ncbi:helix-turn-helix domain-containing protein [Nocardia salmonicida]|uniref:winged helix-turn-helix transcriptional regulator n=1 Tax=Nocardia salmonicida TaxID=53431 RepID=UPI00343D0917